MHPTRARWPNPSAQVTEQLKDANAKIALMFPIYLKTKVNCHKHAPLLSERLFLWMHKLSGIIL